MVFSAVSLAAIALVRVRDWAAPSRSATRLQLAAAAVASVSMLAPFLYPYYEVGRGGTLTHTFAEISHYSASWRDYLATGGRLHFEWWSRPFMTGSALFPGLLALVLAAIAIGSGELRRNARARMAATIAMVGLAFSFGTTLPGYWWLHQHVPLLGALRNVERWGWLALAGIAILAGFGTAVIGRWIAARQSDRAWPILVITFCMVITIEALRAPVAFTQFDGVPRLYERLSGDERSCSPNSRFTPARRGAKTAAISSTTRATSSRWSMATRAIGRHRGRLVRRCSNRFRHRRRLTHYAPLARRISPCTAGIRCRHGDAALAAIDNVPGLTLLNDAAGIKLYRLK